MAENHTTTIQISSIEVNKGRYKIRTTGGETYSFFDNWQGNTTTAMETFQATGAVVGTVVDIMYTESASVNQNTGRPIVYKNIQRFMASPGAVPVGGVAPPRTQATQGNGGVRTIGSAVRTLQVDEARLEAEIIGKMAFGFLQSAIENGSLTLDTARGKVDQAVMLAEAVLYKAKGPNRPRSEPETELSDMPFEPWEEEQNAQR
jgi:hypothetical protein